MESLQALKQELDIKFKTNLTYESINLKYLWNKEKGSNLRKMQSQTTKLSITESSPLLMKQFFFNSKRIPKADKHLSNYVTFKFKYKNASNDVKKQSLPCVFFCFRVHSFVFFHSNGIEAFGKVRIFSDLIQLTT